MGSAVACLAYPSYPYSRIVRTPDGAMCSRRDFDGEVEMTSEITHPWDVTVEEAMEIQRRLAPLAHAAPPIALDRVRLVAGVDVAYADRARGAVVVFRYPEMEVV